MSLDRRAFLRGALGAAGAVALSSCGRGSERRAPLPPDAVSAGPTTPLLAPNQLAPAPRPTVRLPAVFSLFFPNPFTYIPPAYAQVILIYDTLLQSSGRLAPDTASNQDLLPWLAASYQPSPDGLTHRFRLRDGVRWHDGQPLTADDVAFSFDYYRDRQAAAKVPSVVLFPPENVAQVRTRGALGVEIVLDQPAVTFARNVAARFPIVPRHIWSGVSDPGVVYDDAMLVGSGPFRRRRGGRFGSDVFLAANDDYFLGRPFVAQVQAVNVADELFGLRADRIDVAGFSAQPSSIRELARLQGDPSFAVLVGPLEFPTALYWNLERRGPLTDLRFRRACAHAIDRHDLVRRLLGGLGAAGNPGFLPPGHPYAVEVEQYGYDPSEANRLLDQAGYRRPGAKGDRRGPDGKPLRFKLSFPPDVAQVTEVVKASLEAVGIGIDVDPVDPLSMFSKDFDFDMALLFYGGVNDPDGLRGAYSSTLRAQRGYHLGAAKGYVNPQVDELADRQLVAQDPAERHRLVAQIQQIVAADLPFLNLFYRRTVEAVRRSVFDDQWARPDVDPIAKVPVVTGLGGGGTTVRPIRSG